MDTVYGRSGSDTVSRRMFFLVIGAVLGWGFFATAAVAEETADWRPDIIVMLLVGLGIPLVGIFMSRSESAIISFIGFNLVAIPFGAMLGPVFAHYELMKPGVVAEAVQLTGMITVVMAATGVMFPKFYEGIGGALFAVLLGLIVVRFVGIIFFPAILHMTALHYLGAGLFSLYIGYDMHRACTIPATLDNAVDVCISLYLDIINLLLELLPILASSDD